MLPLSHSHPLPPYRGLLAVDVVRFTGNRDRHLPELSKMIPDVLQQAFIDCGHERIWREKRFPDKPGDAYVFGVAPEQLPFLIHPFLDSLQATLWENGPALRSADRKLTMRLRVSINVGPAHDRGDPERDRIGRTTNDTFRLLDSKQLKEIMAATDPDVTLVGAIVSQRVFQDAVLGGYTGVHESQFRRVTAEVPGKGFQEEAWIYVPRLTFRETESEAAEAGVRTPEDRGRHGRGGPVFNERVEQAFTDGTFHGDFHFGER
ncbi:hypothetical protein [Microbispora sp. NPDC049633]|uniref:hypothetical protein n=1 Tax=Microbispora sp. NPDC049633 TaxID=3154355 RepID=UPI00344456BC